jgi:cell division protein FtsB
MTASAFTQRSAKVAKLEKANKKLKRSWQKLKHDYDSDSDESNYS